MLVKQLGWAGTTLTLALSTFLGAAQVSAQLPRWALVATGAAVIVIGALTFPYRDATGQTSRAIRSIRNRGVTFIAGENATQISSSGKNATINVEDRRR